MIPNINIILPVLNEEVGLKRILSDFKKMNFTNFIILDGNSTDKTIEIAKKYKSKIIVQDGTGKGDAFQKFLNVYPIKSNDYYVMLDGDYSYYPKDIVRFIKKLNYFDVVMGNRTTIRFDLRHLIHYFGNKFISLFALILYGSWNPDICTGYWGFKGGALKKMNIRANNFDLEVNLFSECIKKNITVKSIKINYGERYGVGKLKSIDAFVILKRLYLERFYN